MHGTRPFGHAGMVHGPHHRRVRTRWVVAGAAVAVVATAAAVAFTEVPNSGRARSISVPPEATPLRRSGTSSTLVPSPRPTSTALPRVPPTRPAPRVATPATSRPAAADPVLSSCRSVVDIGDSTSETLNSANYLPNPEQRLTAQYARVGVVHQNMQISGARSIVETFEGQPNAYTVARQIAASGYKGCWVVDMGVNDAANIAAGSNVGALERIQRMMSVIGSQPVLWIAVRTLVSSGPYAENHMQAWNASLLQLCPAYPNMRVLDWGTEAQPPYYIADGIHYNTPGSAVLAAALANGLARAFPASGPLRVSCSVP